MYKYYIGCRIPFVKCRVGLVSVCTIPRTNESFPNVLLENVLRVNYAC